ncbi:MAG: HAD family hydrolase [Promethearchaeota archaeon]
MNTNVSAQKIGFVFDLDGTLLDDVPFFISIPEKVAKIYQLEISDELNRQIKEEIMSILIGSGSNFLVIKLFSHIAKQYGLPWYKRYGFLKKVIQIYREGIVNCPLFPECEETLDNLKSHYGPIGILTTSSVLEIDERFEIRREFLKRFDGSIIGRDTVKKMKPNPEGILKLSQSWQIPPKRIVMIGDMWMDIEAGKKAGALTIGVLTGFSSRGELETAKPDFILESIADLPSIMPEIIKKVRC